MYDLIVVGAGPAGLELARVVSKAGYRVLVLDKKKNAGDIQYSSSGTFMSPEDFNLPKKLFHPIDSFFIGSDNLSIRRVGKAYVLDRRALLEFLEKDGKADIEYSALVRKFDFKKVVYLKKGQSKSASGKVFADCSGPVAVLSNTKAPIGMGVEFKVSLKSEPNTMDFFLGKFFPRGYGWIFPTSKKEAVIGTCTLDMRVFKELLKHSKKMFGLQRIKERVKDIGSNPCFGIIRVSKPLKKLVKENLLVVGDAGCQTNPLGGEGIRFVMDAARLAGESVIAHFEKGKTLKTYEKSWLKKYYKKYLLCYKLQEKALRYIQFNGDLVLKKLAVLSDAEFMRGLRADISYPWILKIMAQYSLSRSDLLKKLHQN